MDGAGQALREEQMLIIGCAPHLASTTRELCMPTHIKTLTES
jgi:hypothetical protein